MESTFFHELFVTFSKTDVRRFRQFVASPYFNGRGQLLPLLEHFITARQLGVKTEPTAAFAAAFPGEAFDGQKWRLTLSQLYKLAEEFLAHEELSGELNFPKLSLARAYRKRGLTKHFERSLSALEKERLAQLKTERPPNFYEEEYQLEWERYRFLSSGKRTESFNLQTTSELMDKAFIARKLRYACIAHSHLTVFRTEYRFGLLDAVLQEVKNSPDLQVAPDIGLYYHCFLLLTENGERQFGHFQKLLLQQGHCLPLEERRHLFLHAINYGIRKINDGQASFDRPVLGLYRSALDSGLLLDEGRLSRFAFNNIVAIGLRIGETDWVEQFIHQHKGHLEREHRSVTCSLNLARLEYVRKNYREALLHLQRSDFKDLINNLIAKTLQLKIYYETGEHEVLEAHLRNMKNFIRRQGGVAYHGEIYLNIIRFTQALMELNPFDKQAKAALREEVENTLRLTEREWLLGQL